MATFAQEFDTACFNFVNKGAETEASRRGLGSFCLRKGEPVTVELVEPGLITDFFEVIKKYMTHDGIQDSYDGEKTTLTFRIQKG